MAIVDQGRALAGESSLDGYTQTLPALYQLSSADFHDVTSGSNGGYQAGPGFDLVTGRGTPVANLVVRDLIGGSSTTGKPPTIATAAKVVSSTSTTATLSVLGSDPVSAASTLTYTWTATGGTVTFSANGTNAAQNTTATFSQAGSYTFQVTVTNPLGLTATSQVAFTVVSTGTSLSLTPATATVAAKSTQQFSAKVLDQFGNALATQPKFTWSLGSSNLGSTISTTGLFTAGTTAGSVTVQVASGTLTGKATVTIPAANPVLFQDNFASGAGNWTVTSGSGTYYLVNVHGSNRLLVYNNGFTTSRIVAGQSTWTNYSYQATLNISAFPAAAPACWPGCRTTTTCTSLATTSLWIPG